MKEQYTHDEMLEILRQVMFYGTPETYDNGGKFYNIPPTDTKKRTLEAFNKYYLKQTIHYE